MFSNNQKDTAFFSPLNQFSDVCKRALKAVPGINKAFKNFLTDTLLMFALLPRKVNFTQLEIYGKYCEKTYRSRFSKSFEWVDFNLELSSRLFKEGDRKAIAIDPSYISKSGKHTHGIGRFWSGCAQQVKHGLEILGIGLIDIDRKDCVSLKAVQTPSPKSLAECGVTLVKWYLTCILNLRDKLIRQSRYVVADAYFSVSEFANGLEEFGFHLVSRFRSDAAMMYLYTGGRTGKKGRPKEYDGKIDFKNLDMEKVKKVNIFPDEGAFYTTIAYSKSLKRKVRLVVFLPNDGKPILYFSTDTNMSARNVVEFYRTRFQIEFCYRDSKQFTGLCDCQARDFDKLDFAFNASLTSVNVAKVVINTEYPTFSIANIKSLLYNCYLMKRFFAMSGFRPNKSLNAIIFKELSDIAARAA
jgi:hypothetical protein